MKKEVLLIFKTHLDIGFTDYAKNVVDKYLTKFIPNAIKVGYELKDTDTPFIWTTGSWLIYEALKYDESGAVAKALEDGIISWHGLPFTTHTELMNKELFEYGLSVSARLDKKFGKKTIAAKMTDVPGHTKGMVPLMQKHGIEFLHIGVNPATPVPEVPPIFKWRCGESEITVMYQTDYGDTSDFGDFVICFAHTNDNCGPQSASEIIEIYERVREKYPDCDVKAATLNDVALKIRSLENLPVIDKEIGDTWIHGAGTDPKKVAIYRELLRHIEENGIGDADLTDNLLLVPEHTWGQDVKTHFPDWSYLNMNIPDSAKNIEASWQEQREYTYLAQNRLGINVEYNVVKPDLCGFYEAEYQPEFEISWQLFDNSDYERYKEKYVVLNESTEWWAVRDLTKFGLEEYKGGIFTSKVTKSYTDGKRYVAILEFEKALADKYGLPVFTAEIDGGGITIKWFDKKPLRLPNAFWLKFRNMEENWQINKMGQWISPDDIIGSPLITALDKGIRNSEKTIISLDAALAAPYGRRLLDYDLSKKKQDMYFNLYNNVWNTNFPMWYSDDTQFRFIIK